METRSSDFSSVLQPEEMQMRFTTLNPSMLIVIVGVVLVIGVALWTYRKYKQKKRTQKLRSKFGPEYDKAISEYRDRGHAESELQKRATRVAKFHIHPLKAEDRSRFIEDWRREQSLFVDDPRAAVNHADTLVQDVMQRRGYPVGDFDQNATDLSVDHPLVVENYRIAHEIAQRQGQGLGTTEDLRKAMISYRALFEDLLEQTVEKPEEVTK
jgi:hypothetical protein